MEQPLILVTNDDGVTSRALWATVRALLDLGQILVVAPDRQWSGAGRSMPQGVTGRLADATRTMDGVEVTAYAVDASPAQAIVHGILELAPRPPDLVVSGINFGANLGIEVTVSGTIGAALEASAFGIPALAVSQEMASIYHLSGDNSMDYAVAAGYARHFAELLLTVPQPQDVDVLNVNIPARATAETPWRFTRLSRARYFTPLAPDRRNGGGRPGYGIIADPTEAELDSDLWALLVDGVVSVTPLSLNLTSHVNLDLLQRDLTYDLVACQEVVELDFCPLIAPVDSVV
jgi:5'-nucleotidase